MALSIQPVVTQRDLKRFVTFPWRIYRDDPNWVPPLIAGQMDKLTPGRNPFWEHAERALWLATEGGQPVGTIAAIVDHASNRALGQAIGSFGFFECVNDPAAARLLLDTAANWLAARGMTVMCGPYNPGGNDEPGLLVEGHDTRPALMEGHTPPYYMRSGRGSRLPQAVGHGGLAVGFPTAGAARRRRHPAETAANGPMGRKPFAGPACARSIFPAGRPKSPSPVRSTMRRWRICPTACRSRKRNSSIMSASFKPLVDPALAFFAEVNGEPVAFALTLPDLNEALQHVNGRLWPFGALKLWWHSRHLRRATFKILMIRPEFRGRGLESLLTTETARAIFARGFREVDMSLTGEDNENMQRMMAGLGMQVYRRYRVYERTIDDRP